MRHKKQKKYWYIDEHGDTHIIIDTTAKRNEMHFQTQLHTHGGVVVPLKYRKPKHKNKIFEDE